MSCPGGQRKVVAELAVAEALAEVAVLVERLKMVVWVLQKQQKMKKKKLLFHPKLRSASSLESLVQWAFADSVVNC